MESLNGSLLTEHLTKIYKESLDMFELDKFKMEMYTVRLLRVMVVFKVYIELHLNKFLSGKEQE